MAAIPARCDRCDHPLTAEHVLRAGACHCYACDLRLLRAQDASGRTRRAGRALRLRRRLRRGLLPVVPTRSVAPDSDIAARRPGHGAAAGHRRALPVP